MELGKYSFGIGDRFGLQGKALLSAIIEAEKMGVRLTPVWNKSYREHLIVDSKPEDARREADEAVQALGWSAPYFVDADHVNPHNVRLFIQAADFFTVDVAEALNKSVDQKAVEQFVRRHAQLLGCLRIPGIDEEFEVTATRLEEAGRRYLAALDEAAWMYQLLAESKGDDSFVLELSMDETVEPQQPLDLLLILAEAASRGLPVQTIAPRFPGKLNKGVDYAGDIGVFRESFRQCVAVVEYAARELSLPRALKLSFHSGSDKFTLYAHMRSVLQEFDAGIHIKTAGTTWLEELAGLASAGDEGLATAKHIYRTAYQRRAELTPPYAAVVDIDPRRLPLPDDVDHWDEEHFVRSLKHDLHDALYNAHFRQLLHISYKVAAEMGTRFTDLVLKHQDVIGDRVRSNILERHIRPLFIGD